MVNSLVIVAVKSTTRKQCNGDIQGFYALRAEGQKSVEVFEVDFSQNDTLEERKSCLLNVAKAFKPGDLIVGWDIEVAIGLLFRDFNLCIKNGAYFSKTKYANLNALIKAFFENARADVKEEMDAFLSDIQRKIAEETDLSVLCDKALKVVNYLESKGFLLENHFKEYGDQSQNLISKISKSYASAKELSKKVSDDLARNGFLEEVLSATSVHGKTDLKESREVQEKFTEQPSLNFEDDAGENHDNSINRFTVIDIECSGVGQADGEIIEIAAIKYKGDLPIETFQILIEPDNPVKPESFKTHQISDSMLQGCVKIGTAIRKLASFLDDDNVIVGSNVKTADLRLLNRDAHKCGYPDLFRKVKYIDIVDVAKVLHPEYENRRLGTLVEKLGIKPKGDMHRALCDCYAEAEVFLVLKKEAIWTNNRHALTLRKF